MNSARFLASSVLNKDGDMWVIGGTSTVRGRNADSTEVYKYQPKGKGLWTTGDQLPGAYRDTGIASHCTVR